MVALLRRAKQTEPPTSGPSRSRDYDFRTVTAETMQLSYHITFQAELAPVLWMLHASNDSELIAPKTSKLTTQETESSKPQNSQVQNSRAHGISDSKLGDSMTQQWVPGFNALLLAVRARHATGQWCVLSCTQGIRAQTLTQRKPHNSQTEKLKTSELKNIRSSFGLEVWLLLIEALGDLGKHCVNFGIGALGVEIDWRGLST